MQNLSVEEHTCLQQELVDGEAVIWSGKPNVHVIFHQSDLYVVPFSLLWGGFSIFWEMGVSGHGFAPDAHPSYFMMLWGLPFVVAGQFFIWGRFFYAAWKKLRVIYALTDRRAIALVRPPMGKTISVYLQSIASMEKTVRSDGIGTIFFGPIPPIFSSGRSSSTAPLDGLYLNGSTLAFVDVDEAASLFMTVTNLRTQTQR